MIYDTRDSCGKTSPAASHKQGVSDLEWLLGLKCLKVEPCFGCYFRKYLSRSKFDYNIPILYLLPLVYVFTGKLYCMPFAGYLLVRFHLYSA